MPTRRPSWPTATFQRAAYGWSEFAQQDVETAIRLAQKALEIDEECVLAHSVLARAYTVQQKYDLGLAESERALQINPSDSEVLADARRGAAVDRPHRRVDRRRRAGGAAERQPRARAGAQSRHRLPAQGPLSPTRSSCWRRRARAIPPIRRSISRWPAPMPSWAVADDAKEALEQGKRKDPYLDLAGFGTRFQDPALKKQDRGKPAQGRPQVADAEQIQIIGLRARRR